MSDPLEIIRESFRRSIRGSQILSLVAGIAGIIIVIVTMVATHTEKPKGSLELPAHLLSQMESDRVDLRNLQTRIVDIQKQLRILTEADMSTNFGTQIATVRSEMEAANTRIRNLEEGLLENPVKALSVPLLRNDLENLKRTYRENLESMAKSIDQVYEQNKWFIGLMFTIAIGLISLALSNIIQSRKKVEE